MRCRYCNKEIIGFDHTCEKKEKEIEKVMEKYKVANQKKSIANSNKTKMYLSPCQRCKKKTPHIIFSMSRAKGVKIKCTECGKFKLRYYNLKNLREVKGGIK